MKEKKRLLIGIFFILISLILVENISALGGNPAKKEFNFQPGLEEVITYRISGVSQNKELRLYVQGDLTQYVELNKDKLVGPGEFTATLKLPDQIEKLGKNKIVVVVSEELEKDEELVGGGISVSVSIGLVINIYVPYPGQYLEIELTSKNVNVGEPVDFGLKVISRGTEEVSINPRIEIYDSDAKKTETLYFKNRIIAGQETLNLKKSLDTTNYNPGNYKAVVIIDYGGLAKSESEFKIGNLRIDILNYTSQIPIGKLERFDILVESGWNDQIDGAYAEVVFLNNSEILESFKSSTTTLIPWEKKVITGYFETANFTQGIYDANITLVYYGKDQGKSSSEIVKVEFIKPPSKMLWFIIGGAGLLLIIVLLVMKFIKKDGKKKKKK